MNWDAVDFDWNQARAFLATAEEGSLSAAARALGVTQPTLSRQVSTLEEKLGITLFERGPRTMNVTNAGLEVLQHVRSMHEAATKMSLSASGQSQNIAGMVRLTTTDTMACFHLPDIVEILRRTTPDIDLEIRTSNQLKDLINREADIAIRHARPNEPELIAKKIRSVSVSLYASSKYFDQMGCPKTIEEIEKLNFIGFETQETLIPHLNQYGLNLTKANFPITTDSGPACIEFVKKGLGVGFLIANDAKKFPDLINIWPKPDFMEVPVWLVTHRELHTSRRIRLVFDLLAKHLS